MDPISADRGRELTRRNRPRTDRNSSGVFRSILGGADAPDDDTTVSTEEGQAATPRFDDHSTNELFDEVHRSGQRLISQRTWSAAEHYREAIRAFLRRTVPDASDVLVHESNRDILNRKRYFLITEVNAAVNRLVDGLLSSQREQIDLLARLEEIEGMLVNIVQ